MKITKYDKIHLQTILNAKCMKCYFKSFSRPPVGIAKSMLIMKLTGVLLLTTIWPVGAITYGQTVTIRKNNIDLVDVFKEIRKQTDYDFLYSDKMMKRAKPVDIDLRNASIDETLSQVFAGQPFIYTIKAKTIVVQESHTQILAAGEVIQSRTVRGTVVDEAGNPIEGAVVSIRGGSAVSATTADGSFSIQVQEGAELQISHVAYFTQSVQIGSEGTLRIVLRLNDNLIDQVTITGYTDYTRSKSPSATSQVVAADINQVPMSTLDQILQGRVPGMSVISSSGQPGQSAALVIRGIGSIGGSNAPLYIMDGIPIESGYFQTINPEDIESVNVLKDASAKALYGSRGSNGVIVITTKKGQKGRLSVNYASQYGFSTLTQPAFEMMDARERLRFEEEVGLETGRDIGPGWRFSPRNPNYANQSPAWQQNAVRILDSLRVMNTDWRDLFFQNGNFMEQQVSLSGGNENIQTYNALGLWHEDGIVQETGLKRYSLRSNTNMDYGRFTAGVNLSLGYSHSRFTFNEGGTGVGSPMASVYYGLPYEYPYTADGAFHPTDQDMPFLDTREGSRGIDILFGTSDKTEQFKTILGLNMAYELMNGLTLSTRAGIDLRNSTDQFFVNPLSYYGSTRPGQSGSFEEGLRRNFNMVSTSGITYHERFNQHEWEVSGFFEYLFSDYKAFNYTGYGLDDRLPETPAGITVSTAFLPSLGGGRSGSAMISYMGVGRYTLSNKYTLTASYRYDGASLSSVPLKNRWHGFYSFGAAWDATQEDFIRDSNLISTLRFRTSYGQTASPFGSSFAYMPTYSVSTSYGGEQAIRPADIGNPDFDWEYVDEFNVGMDLVLFDTQRIRLIADWYNRITKNMFIDQPLSATSGASSAMLSTGRMRNQGIEFNLSGDIIQNRDFNWNIGINAAYNRNEILRVTDIVDELPDGDTRIIKVGLPYGTYYAPRWAGVDPANGEALYLNADGSVTNVYNAEQQSVPLDASLYPKMTGGITTAMRWKDLTVNALFSFVSDVQRWNNIDFYIETERYMTSNQSKRMLYDRWKKPGDVAHLQRIDIPRNFTSKDIQEASFMRLRNLKVNYRIPGALFGQPFFQSAHIFVQGENLFTWTSWRGLDPENNRVYGRFEYPNARKYTAGINVNF